MTVARGVNVALLTPVDPAGRVDHDAVARLVGAARSAGVDGVSPLGSTGEGYSLGLDDRLAVIDSVVRSAGPGVPVIAGLFAHGPGQAVAEIEQYQAAGATAVLVAPPSYFPLDPIEVEGYFRTVADSSPLPLVLYNIPVFTKVVIPPAVVAALAAHPMVAGIKDSGRDYLYFLAVLDAVAATGVGRDDFGALIGSDAMLLESLLAGGAGTICASANVVPELTVAIYAAVGAGELDRARTLARQLRRVLAVTGAVPPAATKAAAAARGLCGPDLIPPRRALTEPQTATLRTALHDLGLL